MQYALLIKLTTFATANHILVYEFNIGLVYFHIKKYIPKKKNKQKARLADCEAGSSVKLMGQVRHAGPTSLR